MERREDDADRRRTIVSIDPSIEEAMRPALREVLAPLDRALVRMSTAQRRHLMEGLRILSEEFDRPEGNASD